MGTLALWPAAVRNRLRWFSLTPFDQSTPEGRAQERHRRVALTAAAAALAKVLSVSTALISVPLTLHYLGAERFGMWMTVSSLIAMLAFADFGIANGVLSAVADGHGRDDTPAIQHAVSSGFFMLAGIASTVVVLFAVAYPFVSWHRVFNVQGELARAEAGPALAVFVGCFAAAIPLGVVQRVQMGLQQGFMASLWQCVGSVFGLVGVLVAIQLEGGLPWLVASLAGTPLVAAVLNSLHFYWRRRPDLRPRRQWISRDAARRVASTGVLFFVLQLTMAVAYTSDSIVIAQVLGASAVAAYAVPDKLFGLVGTALAIVLGPLWPAYGEAIARGDSAWVRKTLKRATLTAVGAAAGITALLVLLGPDLIRLWVGDAVAPPLMLLVALAVWKITEAGGTSVAMFLNGARVIRLQLWCAVPTALSAIVLKFWLVQHAGLAGAVWASVVAYLVFTALPVGLRLPAMLRGMHRSA
jgi:O-antigen/teichoic acid export membrane protein